MKIIFSPAKTMKQPEATTSRTLPVYLEETEKLLFKLRQMSFQELKTLWKCSDEIVKENQQRIKEMKLNSCLSPAIYAFEGMAYKHLNAEALDEKSMEYLDSHLRILSGFYGVLRPFDGVRAYRLDMEHRLKTESFKNLYDFWGDKLYRAVKDDSGLILNLASEEYGKCVRKYLKPEDRFISCVFVENVKGQLKQKSSFSKMARGEMLRYMAENKIQDPQELKAFNALNFEFRAELSGDEEFIFERII